MPISREMGALSQQALAHYQVNEFAQSAHVIEAELQDSPESVKHYWYLGLMALLAHDEETAQASWFYGASLLESSDSQDSYQDLFSILSQAAYEQEKNRNFQGALLIRWHLQDFDPDSLFNKLKIIELELLTQDFIPKHLEVLHLNEQLQIDSPAHEEIDLLKKLYAKVITINSKHSLHFAKSCFTLLPHDVWTSSLFRAAVYNSHQPNGNEYAIDLIQLCLKQLPHELTALEHLARLYIRTKHPEAIQTTQQLISLCQTNSQYVIARLMLLDAYIGAGQWAEVLELYPGLRHEIIELVRQQPVDLSLSVIQRLIVKTSLFLYLQDNLLENRKLQNQVAEVFSTNIQRNTDVKIPLYRHQPRKNPKRIKVGYLGNTFRQHSVGWLCRWLFEHHNRDEFDISLYMCRELSHNPFFQTWFGQKVDSYFEVDADISQLAEKIRDDEIDILIDLDSVTLDSSCLVLALKPAPIQVSWLGLDATGISTVDYFIADPYVLPENVQTHYREKILRLPDTYIAVNGFEAHTPTLRRDDLGIPADAIVYLSAQSGYKRFPETVRLQMKIIKEVPNSYFLIKGLAADRQLQELFLAIAEEEGVSSERLKFLGIDLDEYTHRSNLKIADIVLDTYPYNGATTTLETLWMEIPIVTRVGQQFTARNSYAFLKNVGINEGIAWSDEEYIEWGIRLGIDHKLREQVMMKLRQSKSWSPLWNSKRFTHEMEKLYRHIYSTTTASLS